jgi:hypothetical protein
MRPDVRMPRLTAAPRGPLPPCRGSRTLLGADPLEPTDQDAEAGGVEELDALHVHDEVVVPRGHEAVELVAERRGAVDVDLPTDLDDHSPVLLTGADGQIHGSSPWSNG